MSPTARTLPLEAPEEQPPQGAGVDRILTVWGRRKWLVLLVFSVPLCAGTTAILCVPKLYRSTATVLVERQAIPETFVRPTVTSELETRLQTISQKILSRARLEELMTRFNLYPDLRSRVSNEALVERLRRDINLEVKATGRPSASGQLGTVAFALSYTGRDPQTVALVTNTVAEFYPEENSRAREQQAAGTTAFLRAQLAETKLRLEEQERRVGAFKKEHLGELPQQLQANLATLESLTAQLRLTSDNQVRASEHRQTMAVQFAEAASFGPIAGAAGGAGSAQETAPARLARLRQELRELRTRYSDKYPDVVRVKDDIATLEREVGQAKAEGGGDTATSPALPASPYVHRLREALQSADAELKILKSEEQRLRSTIAIYQARVENTPRREQEFQDISRDYESTKELHQSLLKRYEEAQLAENMEQGRKGEHFRLLDPAVPSTVPAAPNQPKLLLILLVFSAGAAVGAAVLAEKLDTSFRSAKDLSTFTGLPVLARISRITTEADVVERERRFRRAVAAGVVGLVLVVGVSFLIAHNNESLVRMLDRGRN
jgi:succinoglycan biosynthesis transport protein ExoP